MSGQYSLTKEENIIIKKIIEKYITSYHDDLFKDNDVSIQKYEEEAEKFYIQFN